MSGKILSPEAVQRAIDLASKPYRPPQIIKLKEDIESRTKALELKSSVSGEIGQLEITEIVKLKLELDRLYGLWAEGKLEY